MQDIAKNKRAQNIARGAFYKIRGEIVPGMTEREIKKRVEMHLINLGSSDFWRYGIGATVHVGPRTLESASTRHYAVTDTPVRATDCIVMDLAPGINFHWGDYARTIFIENGAVVTDYRTLQTDEFRQGIAVQKELHRHLRQVAKPDMTFAQLYAEMELAVTEKGYENLDFSGNYGHSVELDAAKRRVLWPKCDEKLSNCHAFTFEPHIRRIGGQFGLKREDMYYFSQNTLEVL